VEMQVLKIATGMVCHLGVLAAVVVTKLTAWKDRHLTHAD